MYLSCRFKRDHETLNVYMTVAANNEIQKSAITIIAAIVLFVY